MLIPNPAFQIIASAFSAHVASCQAYLRFDTPETTKYIFHAWRIMIISVFSKYLEPLKQL